MGETCLTSLPVDIQLEILQLLSVKDLVRTSQTCHFLRRCVEERSLWIDKFSLLKTDLLCNDVLAISTADLRHKVVSEAAIDELWQRTVNEPLQLEPVCRTRRMTAVEILPGGSHILILFGHDGSIGVHPVDAALEALVPQVIIHPQNCPHIQSKLHIINYTIVDLTTEAGYIVIELQHKINPIPDHRHINIYKICNSSNIEQVASLVTDNVRYFDGWWASGSTLGSLFIYDTSDKSCFFVSSSEIPNSICTLPFTEARFRLLDFEIIDFYPQSAFTMISPTRFIVAGSSCRICIYDFPEITEYTQSLDFTGRSAPTLVPIWHWQRESIPYCPNFSCTATFFRGFLMPDQMVHFVEGDKIIHELTLSESGQAPVKKHVQYPLPFLRDADIRTGLTRGVLLSYKKDKIDLSTFLLSDITTRGSFKINLLPAIAMCSFDELSARLCFAEGDPVTKMYQIFVVNVMS